MGSAVQIRSSRPLHYLISHVKKRGCLFFRPYNLKPLFLITNDDGFRSEGIRVLARRLKTQGEVFIVAPEEERSAVSHALTIRDPVRITEKSPKIFAVHGTPADCVILAVRAILPRKPDLVISGINHGRNLGDDIMYSGTVAGAREACYLDLPAFSISQIMSRRKANFNIAAQIAAQLAQRMMEVGLPNGTFLNINIPPDCTPLGVKWTRQGVRISRSSLSECPGPRGNRFYWIGEDKVTGDSHLEEGSDYEAIREGYISITPLQRDQTSYQVLKSSKGATLLKNLIGF